jgi:PAS domain S-box-containing protein
LEFFKHLTSPDFMPHGYCYLWDPWIVWLHVISDGLITASYYCIPIALVYFIRKNRDFPFNRINGMFVAFILACGTTHLMEVWNVWHGSYLLAGVIKAITAAVSLVTAAMLIPLVPRVISLPSKIHLQEVNRKLEREITERKRLDSTPVEAALRRRVTGGFIVALLLTTFMGFSLWRSTRLAANDADWVVHTYAVMDALELTAKHAIEVETSARAFALSGQDVLLAHFEAAKSTLVQDESALRHLTADNPAQQRRLNVLGPQLRAALEFADGVVAKRRTLRAAPDIGDILETERLTNEVCATGQEMKSAEMQLLSQRTQRTEAGRRLTSFIIVVGIFVGAGLLSLARLAVNREIDVSARARTQISALNAQLEQRVEQRTAALQSEIAERKQAEEALREQAQILDSAQVFVRDMESRIVFWPRGAEKLYGFGSQEALGILSHDLFHTQFPEPLETIEKKLSETGMWEGELIHRKRDGSTIVVSSAWVLHSNSQGRPVRILETNTDITARKQAEQTLAAQTEELSRQADELVRSQQALEAQTGLLQSVLDSMGEGLVAADEQGQFTLWNPAAEKILGLGAAKIPGQEWSRYYGILLPDTLTPFPPDQLPLARAIRGETCTCEMFARNAELAEGVWIEASGHPLKGPDGVQHGGVVAFRDITQRKADEREIRKLNEELEQRVAERTAQLEAANKELADQKFAVDQHAIVAITDVEGTITYVNDKFCAISQYSRDELIGQNHRIMKSGHHPQEFFREMYQTIGDGKVWHSEVMNRAKDGSFYWMDTTIVPFAGAGGRPRRYVAIRADITERKQAEERLLQRTAELEAANQELEAFTYSVSHDLRAPLRHISGFSAILLEEFGPTLDATAQHYLHRIQEGTSKMGRLVDELLNLARVGRHSLQLQITGLNSVVAEVMSILKPEMEGREVQWNVDDLPFVECDPTLIKQVFQNLMANALKFTRPRQRAAIEISHTEEAGQTVIMVRDNGVGFSMKYADKLFGVFQRLHRTEDFEGTGIGLATVRRIIQKHGGKIWAEAELEKGAAFYFTLGNAEQPKMQTNATQAGGEL